MQISDVGQIQDQYDQIYLSPHLDDAVLSCGGSILCQRQTGARVLVVTLSTAAPPSSGPFSALAREFHQQWGLPPEAVVSARLREDIRAMQLVGADFYWAGLLDAIYRAPHAYHSRPTLFGAPAPDDPLRPALDAFLRAIRDRAPHATLNAPLGVGSHVDHLITYEAARASGHGPLRFYEDFPYVARAWALEQRRGALSERFSAEVSDITPTLEQKIAAVAAYTSQLAELFGGAEAMAEAVRGYAAQAAPAGGGYVERFWVYQR